LHQDIQNFSTDNGVLSKNLINLSNVVLISLIFLGFIFKREHYNSTTAWLWGHALHIIPGSANYTAGY